MKITTEYCAGVLENIGGFFIHRPRKTIGYLRFKIATRKPEDIDKVLIHLQRTFGIGSWRQKIDRKKDNATVFYITNAKSINKLTEFLFKYSFRRDYLQLIKRLTYSNK